VKGKTVSELLLYQKKIVENEKNMSNEELLGEVLSQATGDDWDGCFTDKGLWEYNYLESKLRERLSNWLSADAATLSECQHVWRSRLVCDKCGEEY
jgi:hypothetical protein